MNKLILFASGTVVSVGALVAGSGLAFAANDSAPRMGNGNAGGSGYTQQLQVKADALKLTTTQLQEQLQTKTLTQLAAEKGVSMDAVHAAVSAKAHARWEANGLSAEQIKEREADQAERQADCDGSGSGMRGGQHRGQANN